MRIYQLHYNGCYLSHSALAAVFDSDNKRRTVECLEAQPSYIPPGFHGRTLRYAVLVPLAIVQDVPSILLTIRASHLSIHRGQISFPGGAIEPKDSDPIEAALRETSEEVGISPEMFDVWAQLSPHIRVNSDDLVVPVVARIRKPITPSSLAVNRNEVESLLAVAVKDLCKKEQQAYTNFSTGLGYTLPVYLLKSGRRIWGLTAIIIHRVLCALVPHAYKSILTPDLRMKV
ncbi:NUDIX domain containing protein [Trichuris trichiura]|uniref:NUDIX domain containing protein n=1 Tax=Trichuris trichiura TaxID=36087 RepID=A0A077Z122_TRITR|nr:NUDIX domain containing protein [Trichuris trichiura]